MTAIAPVAFASLTARIAPAKPLAVALAPVAVTSPWLATREPVPTSVDAGLKRLQALDKKLEAAHDRRAIFVSVYVIQIQALADDVKRPGRYADPVWMERVTMDFIGRYLDAFDAYDAGDRAHVPAAWLAAFDAAKAGTNPVLGDLMLAMNAHINHDLPLSIAAVGATSDHKADFMRFNAILDHNVNAVQDVLYSRFLRPEGSIASFADKALGQVDETAAGFLINGWRDVAWRNAATLTRSGKTAYPLVLKRSALRTKLYQAACNLTPRAWVNQRLL